MSECQLFDAVANRHGPLQFTSYQRGQKVLGYMLVTRDLLGSINQCGYELFHANIFSNHWGVYLDFSTGLLFGWKIQPLVPPAICDISLNRPHQTAPYWQDKYKYLSKRNWYDLSNDIQTAIDMNKPCNDLAESLYNTLCECNIAAGSKLRQDPPAPYSKDIH